MAGKRLSQLFSLSKDDGGSDMSKSRVVSSSTTGSVDKSNILPLGPPPLLSDSGVVRPASSHGSGSRPMSRVGSAQGGDSIAGSRSRPQTPNLLIPALSDSSPAARPVTPTSAKLSKKKSWLPGRSGDKFNFDPAVGNKNERKAWIAGLKEHIPYDLNPLLTGTPASELWTERGDTFIYLFPRSSGRGPSIKIDSAFLLESSSLMYLREQAPPMTQVSHGSNTQLHALEADFDQISIQGPPKTNRMSKNYSVPNLSAFAVREKHLYLPIELEDPDAVELQGDDLELLILYRNFFAFLLGGALIATQRQLSVYSIFMGISSILKRFEFGNADGSTWGNVALNSFTRYCDELRLADVRSSREKNIEAIVLGEHMKSWSLYNEGFVHAVGRLEDIRSINSPKFSKISPITVNRLERATLDLEQRLDVLKRKLEDFDFPSMFSGIANSQTANERKIVNFKDWKIAFNDIRRFTLAHYRRKYGAWPPKGSSKKNSFEATGLNRLLLRDLYQDFSDLYDMLADVYTITPRGIDMPPMADNQHFNNLTDSVHHVIRRVESEYDRATPPVMPPIPFDAPTLPEFANSFNRNHVASSKEVLNTRRLTEIEVNEVLLGSYNRGFMKATPFIQDFLTYERRLAQGKTMSEIVDLRCGQWLFLYAVLQSLPMTVIDAKDVQFTEGVEHFLCVPPRGGRPWVKDDTSQSRTWYNVAKGRGVVNLPADFIDQSVEGIYRRSHCWIQGVEWAEERGFTSPALTVKPDPSVTHPGLVPPGHPGTGSPFLSATAPLQPSPRASPRTSPYLRPVSSGSSEEERPRSRSGYRSSMELGLEAMNTPPKQASRPVSILNPDVTFDNIIGPQPPPKKKWMKNKK